MHEGHEQHLETLRVDVVAFDLQMHKIGVVFWNELGEGGCSFSAEDEVVEDEAVGSSLVDDEFLNVLSLIYVHLNF